MRSLGVSVGHLLSAVAIFCCILVAFPTQVEGVDSDDTPPSSLLHADYVLPAEALQPTAAFPVIGGIVLVGKLVHNLLDEFSSRASNLIFQAGNTGDALLSKFGNELSVATRNVEIVLSKQQDTLFQNLHKEEQSLFAELNKIVTAISTATERAVTLEEVTFLNLLQLTQQIPFQTHVEFYISSVRGLTQPWQEGDYRLELRGLGIGPSTSNREYTVSVTVGGEEVASNALQQTPPLTLFVLIPHSMLEQYFRDDTVQMVTLIITSKILIKRPVIPDKHETYSMPLKLTLLPKYPGVLQGEQTIVDLVDGPALIKRSEPKIMQKDQCKKDHPCDFHQEIRLAIDETFEEVSTECSGQCAWCYPLRRDRVPVGYGPDCDISEGNKFIYCYRHCNGDQGATFNHAVRYHRTTEVPKSIPLGPFKLQYGKPLTFETHPQNKGCNWLLRGVLAATKQTPFIDSGMIKSVDGTITVLSVVNLVNNCRITIILNIP